MTGPITKYNFLYLKAKNKASDLRSLASFGAGGGNYANAGQIVQRGGLTPGATITTYTYLFAGTRPLASP